MKRVLIAIENDADRIYADEVRALVAAERVAQGLPPTVESADALATLAAVVGAGTRSGNAA